ncbi:MAG: universal stress protein [Desulfobulbaceae bacterium]|nr:universal stress protein [Desulfobulbaceae bacterium]
MKRFKNILLVINDKIDNEAAIQTSVNLSLRNQARLTVIEVLEDPPHLSFFSDRHSSKTILASYLKEKQDALQALFSEYHKDIEIDVLVARGKAFWEIIQAVLRNNFDLVIKACHQHGNLQTMLFGSTDMHLLRKCPCPVWLIKPKKEMQFQRILAAVDIEPSLDDEKLDSLNQQILEMSTSLALSEFAELHIVHAWMIVGESILQSSRNKHLQKEVNEWMEDQEKEIKVRLHEFKSKIDTVLGEKGSDYLHPEIHFLEGDAYEIIPRVADEKEVDLVIMGTIARTGLPGFFLGNTAESILNQLNCSVLAIKPEGFVSPVTL